MPEHASRFAAALYDQFEEEHRVADWGGDELFTRMPRPRAVDDAPSPRFRRSQAAAERPLALVDPPADRRATPDGEERSEPRERRAAPAEQVMPERAERLGVTVVADAPPALRDGDGRPGAAPAADPLGAAPVVDPLGAAPVVDPLGAAAADEPLGAAPAVAPPRAAPAAGPLGAPRAVARAGRPTKLITGRPDGAPRPPAELMSLERRRPARTPAEWVGARPERIVAWAFALGLLLILIAISTADAAPV